MYSLFAPRNHGLKAKVNETLTRGEYHSHACFRGETGMLACIKHGTMLTVNEVRFTNLTAAWIRDEYEGKPLTVRFVEMNRRTFGRKYAADGLEVMKDGFVIPFGLLADGVTAFIPRKVRKDKGVAKPRNLRKVLGLDQPNTDVLDDLVVCSMTN